MLIPERFPIKILSNIKDGDFNRRILDMAKLSFGQETKVELEEFHNERKTDITDRLHWINHSEQKTDTNEPRSYKLVILDEDSNPEMVDLKVEAIAEELAHRINNKVTAGGSILKISKQFDESLDCRNNSTEEAVQPKKSSVIGQYQRLNPSLQNFQAKIYSFFESVKNHIERRIKSYKKKLIENN